VLFTDNFTGALAAVVGWITEGIGWLYMLITAFFLGFVVCLAFSRHGKVKLGRPDDEPEFGYFAWFAILFPAGMGIGLVFWGVIQGKTRGIGLLNLVLGPLYGYPKYGESHREPERGVPVSLPPRSRIYPSGHYDTDGRLQPQLRVMCRSETTVFALLASA
jgi:hypothetical protein